MESACDTLEAHLKEFTEPQYRSILIMRLIQVGIEEIKPKEMADVVKKLYHEDFITKQQIRRGLMRLIWRFEDILLDYPKALNVLA